MSPITRRRAANTALRKLARLHGVQLRYRSNDGSLVDAGSDVLVAILSALGEPLDSPDDAPSALDAALSARSSRALEPVMVHRPGRATETTVTLKKNVDPDRVALVLQLEDGTTTRWKLSDHQTVVAGQDPYDEMSLRYRTRATPRTMPAGYHGLRIDGPGVSARSLLIAAPSQCPKPQRGWSAFIPLYALRRRTDDWGVGSFGDLRDLARWTNSVGGTSVGTLPLLAAFIDQAGKYTGPYQPASKLAWNVAHVDVESLPELHGNDRWSAGAREMITSARSTSKDSDRADVASVIARKRPVLELLARSLNESANDRHKSFNAFVDSRPELIAYARFMAACESQKAPWQSWSLSARREIPDSFVEDAAVLYHLYSQWVADLQLAEVRDHGLYLDMPIGVHPSGFDTWWEPESFVAKVSGGAPPDAFFAGGQSWGFPPLHPERIRDCGYSYVISYLRQVMTHASIVRVDHVMGLDRLYWVPDGFDARHGAYVRYHADEMHALVVLEASRSATAVVGEDLGTVPTTVRKAMARDWMLSSFVEQFESSPDDPLPVPAERTLASFGTHDLPTFDAYWGGLDIDERRLAGQIDPPEADAERKARTLWRDATIAALHLQVPASGPDAADPSSAKAALEGVLVHLAKSPASVVTVDLEDLWLETDQQNRPGTGPERHNFTRRAARTFEEMTADPFVIDLFGALTDARAKSLET